MSAMCNVCVCMRMCDGMAVMTPMMGSDVVSEVECDVSDASVSVVVATRCRSTQCHCGLYPGGMSAHVKKSALYVMRSIRCDT